MNRRLFIKNLVSQFEEQIRTLPDTKLEELESGKLEISLTQAVGHESGGALVGAVSGASASLAKSTTSSTTLSTATASPTRIRV